VREEICYLLAEDSDERGFSLLPNATEPLAGHQRLCLLQGVGWVWTAGPCHGRWEDRVLSAQGALNRSTLRRRLFRPQYFLAILPPSAQ